MMTGDVSCDIKESAAKNAVKAAACTNGCPGCNGYGCAAAAAGSVCGACKDFDGDSVAASLGDGDPRIKPATAENIKKAADIIKSGGLAAFPTETVYGLGANGLDEAACRRIYAAKGRPSDNPLILHVASVAGLIPLVDTVPPMANALFNAFSPGPLTVVLKKSARVPSVVSGGLDTVAVRIPSHLVARSLIKAAGVPVAAPSANKSGRPSPTTAAHVAADIGDELEIILDGGACEVGLESTIVSLATNPPRLLRPGGISLAQLEAVLGRVEVDGAVTGDVPQDVSPAAPGMKYRHYAPKADVFLLNGSSADVLNYMVSAEESEKAVGILCLDGELTAFGGTATVISLGGTAKAAAAGLYSALRLMDEANVSKIYCKLPPPDGDWLAVYNRLIKAAAGRVIKC